MRKSSRGLVPILPINSLSFFFCQRLDVVIDFLEVDATLPEQPVHLATLGSSWLFVDRDFIFHGSSIRVIRGIDFVVSEKPSNETH